MNYLYLGGNPQNGLVSIDNVGTITIDNKQYAVRYNLTTGNLELVAADGTVTIAGAAGGNATKVNLLADVNLATINSWVGATGIVDVVAGRPANTKLKAIITLATEALVNGTIVNQTADVSAGIIPYTGVPLLTSADKISGEALKSVVPNLVSKQDLNFPGGIGANVAAGLVTLTFQGVVAGVPTAFVGGQFTAGAFKVFGVFEELPTADALNSL